MSDGTERIAIVTGASRGIGRAVAEALLEEGWAVRFCSRSPESVARAEEALKERFGERVWGRAVDVRRQEEVDGFVDEVADRDGRIDGLVNNAGLGRFGPVDRLTGDEWREVIETNLSGAFYFLRAVAPVMKKGGGGWIFNIASLAGKNPFAGGAAYNASKFGLVGLSEAAMLDLRQDGIKTTVILPGSVDTAFHSREERDWMIQPEDVARMVIDLLAFPERTLPSWIEMRPTRPPKKR